MKKETTTILLCSILSFFSSANNITDPFWQQGFSNGFPTAWSTGDASGQGVIWANCSNPNNCPPATLSFLSCSDTEFRSTGFEDGYMFVNSYVHGPLNIPSQSYLRTELIDCSDKSAVFIQFETYIHAYYKDPDANAVLRVKSGNGQWTTFTIFPNLNLMAMESLQSFNAQPVLIDISSAAANKSNVTIEWSWTANFEVAWMIDDVALFDENPLYDNVVWGNIGGQGDFAGGLNGWTVTNSLDTCRWVWVNNGAISIADNNPKGDVTACWNGVSNGAMLMNASYCNRYGLSSPYSRSDLKSPNINLSSIAAGTKLDLRFNQMVAVANRAVAELPVTSIAVSIDNGLTFIDTISANPIQPYLHGKCGELSFRLPNSVAGKPTVRLIFMFSGDIHYWMVDDVRISLANDQDMAVNPAFFNVAPDFGVPGNQVRPIHLFAQAKNTGNLPMEDVKVYAEVRNSLNLVVFLDSVDLGLVEPIDTWEDVFFPNAFTPSTQAEQYRIFYKVASSTHDQNVVNDKVYWHYKVTEDVFSKNEFCSSSNGYFIPLESYDYEIGNCYYVPKGSNLKAKSMSFAFSNAVKLGAGNAQLSINLYKWKKGANNGDVNLDTIANLDEFDLVAYNIYDVEGDEGGTVVTVPISGDADSVILSNDTYYFVTVGYLSPVAVGGVVQVFPIACSEEINYSAMFYNSYSTGKPGFTSMLLEGDDVEFRANAWTLRRIPFINLNVEQFVNSADPFQRQPWDLTLSPNPASNAIRVSIDKSVLLQPAHVEIFDLCGRLVIQREFSDGIVSQLPIDVSELSNGSYTLRVISGEKMASTKLMVVH